MAIAPRAMESGNASVHRSSSHGTCGVPLETAEDKCSLRSLREGIMSRMLKSLSRLMTTSSAMRATYAPGPDSSAMP